MNQPDLFRYGENTYPFSAGYRDTDTSEAAAQSVDAKTLRAKVLDTISRHGPLTADETAGKIGCNILSIRPRLTELKRLGKITDTGERRENLSGRKAAVYRLAA